MCKQTNIHLKTLTRIIPVRSAINRQLLFKCHQQHFRARGEGDLHGACAVRGAAERVEQVGAAQNLLAVAPQRQPRVLHFVVLAARVYTH